MRPLAVLVALAAALTACSEQVWTGGTAADWKRDSYACEAEAWRPGVPLYASPADPATAAGLSGALYNLSGALADRGAEDRRYRRCMESRGWRLVDKP